MANYTLDPCVEGELDEIWAFIAQDNPTAATSVVEAAFSAFAALAKNPSIGTRRKFRSPVLRDIRALPLSDYPKYLVFYRAVPEGVQIIHVLHGARDLEAIFVDD